MTASSLGNVSLDLSARIILEEGAGIAPGTTIMTHNNCNDFLDKPLAHTCGKRDVRIKRVTKGRSCTSKWLFTTSRLGST
jgi:hypothetical protein